MSKWNILNFQDLQAVVPGISLDTSSTGITSALKVIEGAFHGFEIAGLKTGVVREFRHAYFDALRDALCR